MLFQSVLFLLGFCLEWMSAESDLYTGLALAGVSECTEGPRTLTSCWSVYLEGPGLKNVCLELAPVSYLFAEECCIGAG